MERINRRLDILAKEDFEERGSFPERSILGTIERRGWQGSELYVFESCRRRHLAEVFDEEREDKMGPPLLVPTIVPARASPMPSGVWHLQSRHMSSVLARFAAIPAVICGHVGSKTRASQWGLAQRQRPCHCRYHPGLYQHCDGSRIHWSCRSDGRSHCHNVGTTRR